MKSGFKIFSIWEWELWRNGVKIDEWKERNVVTDEGLDNMLDVHFSQGTQITAWFIAIFENNYSPTELDTYAVPGFTECTAYDEANRPGWQEGGVTLQSITNDSNKASFTMNATKSIFGGALVGGGTDADTKGDTAGGGKMFCSSQFASGVKNVEDDDVLKVVVTIQGMDIAEATSSSSSSLSSSQSVSSSSSSST